MSNSAIQTLPSVSRRQCLSSMLAGATGCQLALRPGSQTASANETAIDAKQPIRSCIVLFHYGGPSHLESFDPKPHAPAEVRGEYQTISTTVPGTQISEHWPLTARVMDRIALVRSVHHPMRNHNSAASEVLTGRTPASGDLELLADEARSFPSLGSAVAYGLARAGRRVVAAVHLAVFHAE